MKALYGLVGMKFRGTEQFVASLPKGEPLTLVREPTNGIDPNAVQVWARERHIGYVKAAQVRPLARRMDGIGAPPGTLAFENVPVRLPAKLAVSGDRWPMVEVDE